MANYIHTLQEDNAALKRELEAVKTGLNLLRVYLHSHKFFHGDRLDGYVNTGDVLAWLRDAEDAGRGAREQRV